MSNNFPYHPYHGVVDAIVFNALQMPGKELIRSVFTIAAGQTLKAGSVLGAITATGKLVLCVDGAGDGSEVPFAVLLEDLDTTAGDKDFSVAVEGFFNETALVFGGAHDADSVRVPLRKMGIYLGAPAHSFTGQGAI